MLPYILFIIFDFITHKQFYSSNHFTGRSTVIPIILKIIAIINTILIFAFLILIGVNAAIWKAFVLITVAEIVKYILNRWMSRRVLRRLQKQGWNINGDEKDPDGTMFYSFYNRKCDVAATKAAVFGTFVNIAIIIVLFLIG